MGRGVGEVGPIGSCRCQIMCESLRECTEDRMCTCVRVCARIIPPICIVAWLVATLPLS
jgi:hypothetical protein